MNPNQSILIGSIWLKFRDFVWLNPNQTIVWVIGYSIIYYFLFQLIKMQKKSQKKKSQIEILAWGVKWPVVSTGNILFLVYIKLVIMLLKT